MLKVELLKSFEKLKFLYHNVYVRAGGCDDIEYANIFKTTRKEYNELVKKYNNLDSYGLINIVNTIDDDFKCKILDNIYLYQILKH